MSIFVLPGFILRLCKLVSCEEPPPLLHGREDESHRRRSRAYVSFAKHHPPSLDLRGAMNFYTRDFDLGSSLIKDFSALGSSLMKIFMSSSFSPWALRSQGLFCLRLFAHKDFYVFEYLPWALRSQGLFCLRLFAHKDFVI